MNTVVQIIDIRHLREIRRFTREEFPPRKRRNIRAKNQGKKLFRGK